jgi:hypothetical protein
VNFGGTCGTAPGQADAGGAGGSAGFQYEVLCATVSPSGYGCAPGSAAQLNNVFSDGYFPPMGNELLTQVTNATTGLPPNTVTIRDAGMNTGTVSNANLAWFTDNSVTINSFLNGPACATTSTATTAARTGCTVEVPIGNATGLAAPINLVQANVTFVGDGAPQAAQGTLTSSFAGAGRFPLLVTHGFSSNLGPVSIYRLGVQDISNATLCASCEYSVSPNTITVGGNVPTATYFRNVQSFTIDHLQGLNFAAGTLLTGDAWNGSFQQGDMIVPTCYNCSSGLFLPDMLFDINFNFGQLANSFLAPNPAQSSNLINTLSRHGIFIGNETLTPKISAGLTIGPGAVRSYPWGMVFYDVKSAKVRDMKGEQVNFSPADGVYFTFDGSTSANCAGNSIENGYTANFNLLGWITPACTDTFVSNIPGNGNYIIQDQSPISNIGGQIHNNNLAGQPCFAPFGMCMLGKQAAVGNPDLAGEIMVGNVFPSVSKASGASTFPLGVALNASQNPQTSIRIQTTGYVTVLYDTGTNAGDCNGTSCTTTVGHPVCIGTTNAAFGLPQSSACAAGKQIGLVAQAGTTVSSGIILIQVH